MWEENADDDGHRLCTFALITTTPDTSVAQHQHRLPAMLTREAEQA
jgi:putative SOS response-associated peptidase YedK